jgi:hypothetical protein
MSRKQDHGAQIQMSVPCSQITVFVREACHTRFSEENQVHTYIPRVQARQGTERGGEGDLVQVLTGVGDQGEQPDSGEAAAQADCDSNSTGTQREGKED